MEIQKKTKNGWNAKNVIGLFSMAIKPGICRRPALDNAAAGLSAGSKCLAFINCFGYTIINLGKLW